MPLRPHSELVAKAWILSIPGMLASAGTTLPGQVDSWAANGFYQLSVAGGRRHRDVPQTGVLIQVDCFAANTSSGKPPWGRANQMAETVIANTYNGVDTVDRSRRLVTLPAAYYPAIVQTVEAVTEPRRMLGDESRIAHFSFDALITWIPVIA